ncbi:hypothetical protein A3Q56_04498, partial [Intoshia linei]
MALKRKFQNKEDNLDDVEDLEDLEDLVWDEFDENELDSDVNSHLDSDADNKSEHSNVDLTQCKALLDSIKNISINNIKILTNLVKAVVIEQKTVINSPTLKCNKSINKKIVSMTCNYQITEQSSDYIINWLTDNLPSLLNKTCRHKSGSSLNYSEWKNKKKPFETFLYYFRMIVLMFKSDPCILQFITFFESISLHLANIDNEIFGKYLCFITYHWSCSNSMDIRNCCDSLLTKLLNYCPNRTNSMILKSLRKNFIINCKFYTTESKKYVEFMHNSFVNLCIKDVEETYSLCFNLLKNLATLARNVTDAKNKNNTKSFQFYLSLKFVTYVICKYLKNEEKLNTLIQPLIEVIICVIKINSSNVSCLYRFKCIRLLIYISKETKIFIPILDYILETLELVNTDNTTNKSKISTNLGDVRFKLTISNSLVHDKSHHDIIFTSSISMLCEYLLIYANSVAFPELCYRCVIKGVTLIKESKAISIKS